MLSSSTWSQSQVEEVPHDRPRRLRGSFHLDMELRGIDQVIVVDLTPFDAAYSVVRVIVPGLESWSVNHANLGRRALEYWRAHV